MLDGDVAEVYGTETRLLDKQVRRNLPWVFTDLAPSYGCPIATRCK